MAEVIINPQSPNEVIVRSTTPAPVIVQPLGGGGGGKLQLTPTAEINGGNVLFHFVTLAQMEKMHIRATGVSTMVNFTLTKGEDDFELRFSADSPQEIAGQLILDDSIDMVDDVFGTITVPLSGYEVSGIYMDGLDANLLKADINWRLADIQKRIGEGGEDPYSQALAAFFNITPPVPNAVPMTQQEVEDDLDELWNLIITQ